MAKRKNENTLSYLQMPLPSGRKYSKMTKVSFGGLNKRYTLDSGSLSMERNISTDAFPCLVPSEKYEAIKDGYLNPISMSAFDNFIIVVYRKDDKIWIDYIDLLNDIVHTGILESNIDRVRETTNTPRSIVQFNVYDNPTDPISGHFIKKLLFFPDKASMFMKIQLIENITDFEKNLDNVATDVMYYREGGLGRVYSIVKVIANTDKDGNVTYQRVHKVIGDTDYFVCDGMDVLIKTYTNDTEPYLPPDTASHNYYYKNLSQNAKDDDTLYGTAIYRWVDDKSDKENSGWKISIPPTMPDIKYATVHLSRVFGVDDDRVYASGYNDYTNWNLDAIDEYNESNAWCSPSQSNTKAGSGFTGITTFQSHVICFKKDFMHEIYNTKNPFRLQDIYAEGAIDNRSIQDVDGKLIFVSEDDVKVYTGSNPRIIGHNLNMPHCTYAVSGTDNRHYYLFCEDDNYNTYLYVYDTFTDLWSERSSVDNEEILSFAHNNYGMYMLTRGGTVYKMDTNKYNHSWSFETDLITNKTVDIKHIKKLQMLVDIPEEINGIDNLADDEGNSAYMKVYILYDDEEFDENKSHLVYTSNKTGQFPIRVKPRKTANYGFKLHFEGAGYMKLYELEIFFESGGDLLV